MPPILPPPSPSPPSTPPLLPTNNDLHPFFTSPQYESRSTTLRSESVAPTLEGENLNANKSKDKTVGEDLTIKKNSSKDLTAKGTVVSRTTKNAAKLTATTASTDRTIEPTTTVKPATTTKAAVITDKAIISTTPSSKDVNTTEVTMSRTLRERKPASPKPEPTSPVKKSGKRGRPKGSEVLDGKLVKAGALAGRGRPRFSIVKELHAVKVGKAGRVGKVSKADAKRRVVDAMKGLAKAQKELREALALLS